MAQPELEPSHDGPPESGHASKVDITVAEHTVIVEAREPLDKVAAVAMDLFERTKLDARRAPAVFAAGAPQTDISFGDVNL